MKVTRNSPIRIYAPKPRLQFDCGAWLCWCSSSYSEDVIVGQGETPRLAYANWLRQYAQPHIGELLRRLDQA